MQLSLSWLWSSRWTCHHSASCSRARQGWAMRLGMCSIKIHTNVHYDYYSNYWNQKLICGLSMCQALSNRRDKRPKKNHVYCRSLHSGTTSACAQTSERVACQHKTLPLAFGTVRLTMMEFAQTSEILFQEACLSLKSVLTLAVSQNFCAGETVIHHQRQRL